MSNFINFKSAIQKKINEISQCTLVQSSISKDDIWKSYLSAFPEGTDPIFRERTEHDCNCCKNFIRNIGGMMAIVNNELVSIWDISVEEPYQTVANELSAKVKAAGVANQYLHSESTCGTNKTPDNESDIIWDHFFAHTPSKAVVSKHQIGTQLGHSMSNKSVLERSVKELTEEAVDTVVELIDQGSLYRGEEHLETLKLLKSCQRSYKEASNKELMLWEKSIELGFSSKIKNTVIGTLVEDLSNGVELEVAVKSFESKVAPANYKRPKALVTEGMIKQAQKKVVELGIESSLNRRHATIDDLTINNVLFANREAKADMNVFDQMLQGVGKDTKKFNKVEEVSIEKFIDDILPKADSVELLLENKHEKNLVTLVAPEDATAPTILKWDNNFTWTYNGEVTDSVDERVKAAGGNIEAFMRLSLAWDGKDDLDIHCYTPNNSHIYYHNRRSGGGHLDIDANGMDGIMPTPVENIYWKEEPRKGIYRVVIDNYNVRGGNNGFTLNLVVGENRYQMIVNQDFKASSKTVLEFEYIGDGEIKIVNTAYNMSGDKQVKDLWSINSQNFQKVKLMMLSPNHWDDNKEGNKHYFFMLEGCKNPDKVRGFYNEFLRNDLNDHRKVFEVLASKMKADYTEDQLSGLGFSSTKRDELIVKVKGSFERTLKIKF